MSLSDGKHLIRLGVGQKSRATGFGAGTSTRRWSGQFPTSYCFLPWLPKSTSQRPPRPSLNVMIA
jgi:hypothetical protein